MHLKVVAQPSDSVLGNRRQFPAGRTWQLSGLGATLVLVCVVISLKTLLAERVTALQHLRVAVRFEADHTLQQILERRHGAAIRLSGSPRHGGLLLLPSERTKNKHVRGLVRRNHSQSTGVTLSHHTETTAAVKVAWTTDGKTGRTTTYDTHVCVVMYAADETLVVMKWVDPVVASNNALWLPYAVRLRRRQSRVTAFRPAHT